MLEDEISFTCLYSFFFPCVYDERREGKKSILNCIEVHYAEQIYKHHPCHIKLD